MKDEFLKKKSKMVIIIEHSIFAVRLIVLVRTWLDTILCHNFL